jgi:hypothetical protein
MLNSFVPDLTWPGAECYAYYHDSTYLTPLSLLAELLTWPILSLV